MPLSACLDYVKRKKRSIDKNPVSDIEAPPVSPGRIRWLSNTRTSRRSDWSQLLVAEFGPGIELRINPYAQFQSGIVGYSLMYSVDCAPLFPSAPRLRVPIT